MVHNDVDQFLFYCCFYADIKKKRKQQLALRSLEDTSSQYEDIITKWMASEVVNPKEL